MSTSDLLLLAASVDEAHARLLVLHDGALAEQRHLLYDADPDAAFPPFPYPADTDDTARRSS